MRQIFGAARCAGLAMLAVAGLSDWAGAAVLDFSSGDFTITGTPTGNVATFDFRIGLGVPLVPGQSYPNPALQGVDYSVSGSLDPGNPSGFPAFALNRPETPGETFPGTEFYAQGSSLLFALAVGADLTDGLQVSELTTLAPTGLPGDTGNSVLILNAREVGTGRYHPPLFILRADGTGVIMNSNNTGDNPQDAFPGQNIEEPPLSLGFGDEYVTEFSFAPGALTVVAPVPLPAAGLLLPAALAVLALGGRARRRSAVPHA